MTAGNSPRKNKNKTEICIVRLQKCVRERARSGRGMQMCTDIAVRRIHGYGLRAKYLPAAWHLTVRIQDSYLPRSTNVNHSAPPRARPPANVTASVTVFTSTLDYSLFLFYCAHTRPAMFFESIRLCTKGRRLNTKRCMLLLTVPLVY